MGLVRQFARAGHDGCDGLCRFKNGLVLLIDVGPVLFLNGVFCEGFNYVALPKGSSRLQKPAFLCHLLLFGLFLANNDLQESFILLLQLPIPVFNVLTPVFLL